MQRLKCARSVFATTKCLAFLLLASVIPAFSPELAAAGYPKLFRANLNPNPGSVLELSHYDHVAYSYRAPLLSRQAVRMLKPSSIDFAWISALSASGTDTYGLGKALRDSANAYDWWVRRADGSHLICWCGDGYESEWVLDLTDNCPRSRRGERFRDWYARTLVDSLVTRREFHGLFFDQAHSAINWMITLDCNPGGIGIDLNRDGVSDADTTVTRQWSFGIYDFLRQVRQRVGPNYPLVCNGAFNLVYDNAGKRLNDFANGLMFECFLHGSPLGSDFHKSFYNVNRGYYPEESCIQPLGGQKWMIITDSGYCMGLTGGEAERQKRLTLGACLLTDAYYTRPPWEGNDWQPEYEFRLGTPVSGPDSLAGGSQGVWVREFTNGFVAVNPNSYAVTVPGRGITVPARDAVISDGQQFHLGRVTDLAANVIYTNAVQVRFTVPLPAPGTLVPATYRLRALNPAGVASEWIGQITVSAGSRQYANATFLTAGAAYRFVIIMEKSNLPPSAPSDTLRVTTLGGADTQPPATIQSLTVVGTTDRNITLRWTAPADPPGGGAATAYEMRRWLDGGSWNTGTSIAAVPAPAAPGTQQQVLARGLTPNTRYHFQIRSRDLNSNWSVPSPEVIASTLVGAKAAPRASLGPILPNPFSGVTHLQLTVAESGPVDVSVFGADGRLVRVLLRGARGPGVLALAWDGTDGNGRGVPNGVYLCRFIAPGTTITRKMVLLRNR